MDAVTDQAACVADIRDELRSFLRVPSAVTPSSIEVVHRAPHDGYELQHVEVGTDDDVIPALLAIPHGDGPFPAVAVFHQHAGQRHIGKSEVFGLEGDPHQAFGPALARAGLVVLAPDSVAFEDRRPGGAGTEPRDDDFEQHYNQLTHRLVAGDTLMRKVLMDAMAGVGALVDRPDVASDRVAVLGHSYGGNTTLFLTAIDDRIAAGCASGSLASYRRRADDGTGIEMAQVIPGIAERFDLHHVLAAISPRPFLVASGTDDKYSIDAPEVIAAASALGGADNMAAADHLRFDGGHALDAGRFDAILDWMLRTLAPIVGPETS